MTACSLSSSPHIMDVTSLLNSSSAAAAAAAAAALQRRDSVGSSTPSATGDTTATSTAVPTPSPDPTPPRRASGSRSPGRNRTPWDAGGYSLPLTLDTKSIPSFTTGNSRPSFYNPSESPTELGLQNSSASPKSPRHKFSDSHSSLSSFTSSTNTTLSSHSRISSLSTVSEFQQLPTLNNDSSPDCKAMPRRVEGEAADGGGEQQHAHAHAGSISSASFGATPLQARPRDELNSRDDYNSSSVENASPAVASTERPGSPSDAVMIRRGMDSYYSNESPNLRPETNAHLSAEASPSGMAHRRVVSAPGFAPSIGPLPPFPGMHQNYPMMRPSSSHRNLINAQAGPNRSGNRQHFPEINDVEFIHWSTKERTTYIRSLEATLAQLEQEERPQIEELINSSQTEGTCKYPGTCKLDSTPRKAISHLFGRNKLCTRAMPKKLWVHYCRKHYQRCRYRDPQKWARIQARLVIEQIFRLQVWSEMNQRRAEGNHARGIRDNEPVHILRGWTLATRKREQQRLNQKKQKGTNKRARPQASDDEGGSDYDEDDPNHEAGLAVEGWLGAKCGSTYSTNEMLAITHRIEIELQLDTRKMMPDIEILPIIDSIEPDSGKPKTPTSRRRTHKRAHSTGVALGHRSLETLSSQRRVSQPSVSSVWSADSTGSPAEKRQRVGQMANIFQAHPGAPALPPARNTHRTVPTMNSMNSMAPPTRPAFNSIREGQEDERSYVMQPPVSAGPLPVPVPQGVAGTSMAQPATSMDSYDNPSHLSHRRSPSDVGPVDPYTRPGYSYSQSAFRPSLYSQPFRSNYGQNGYTQHMTPTNGYASTSNGYPSVTSTSNAYNSAGASYDSASQTMSSTSNGLPNYSRSQTSHISPYVGSGYSGYPSYVGGSVPDGGMSTTPYGSAAKHMRHQSSPVGSGMPPMTYGSEHSGANSYSSYASRSQAIYGPSSTQSTYAPTYPAPSSQNLPSGDEMDATKGGDFQDRRRW